MRSLFKKAEKKAAKSLMNKRGQIVDTVSSTTMSIMILIFIIFAVLFGIATLNPSSFFTASSAEANATGYLQANLTEGVSQFGGNLPTIFKVLGVVLVLGGIILLVLYVARMRSVSGSGNGGL